MTKSFGKFKAVDNLNLNVKKGELYVFLGVNGAGKSTTIKMICGLLKYDFGSIKVCDFDVTNISSEIKKNIGVVFQNSVLDSTLSIYDNLKFRAGLYNITGLEFKERYKKISNLLDLSSVEKISINKLSGGQRRRVDIARALIHNPKLLILDEPTTGLNPNARKQIWNIIEKLRKEKKLTVFLTTHYMDEASFSSYITIIKNGKIICCGSPLE